MAPKKSSKGKGVAAEPTREEGWVSSKCSESDIETLVFAGLLAHKCVIPWCPALGKDRPYENTGEIVAFTSYLERGLGFSCSFFFSGLLIPLFTFPSSYICAKLFWASSPILSFFDLCSISSPSQTPMN